MNLGEIGPNQGRETEFAARAMRSSAAALLLVGAVGAFAPALAQAPAVVNPVPQGSPVPRILPPRRPSVAPGTVIPPPSAPGAEVPNQPVRVSSVDVEGVTAYPQPEIAQLTAGLVGPAVPLPQIDAARQAILQRYRSDGYVLTTVSAKLDAQRPAALRGHRGAHRQRQAGRRHRSGRHAGAALPQPADREAADRFGRRWSAICCWRRTCRA